MGSFKLIQGGRQDGDAFEHLKLVMDGLRKASADLATAIEDFDRHRAGWAPLPQR